MSRTFDPSADHDLRAAIDRLVADELGDADRRALLLQLDATPDGWRHCALTFLEDQALRSALAQPRVATAGLPVAHPRSLDRSVGMEPLTVARRRILVSTLGRHALAASLFAVVAAASFGIGVRSGERPERVEVGALPLASPKMVVNQPTQPGRPLGWLKLADPTDVAGEPRQVLVLAADEANQRWAQEHPSTIPEYVKVQWERRGYQVEENRRLVGVDLQDGRRVAVPVDEVALDYVGRQPL